MKFMKTLVAVSTLALSVNAIAASTGKLLITGTVANNTYLSLTNMGGNDATVEKTLAVDEIVNGTQTEKNFANLFYEVSNSTGGYSISLTSANSGELRGPNANKVKYSLDYTSNKIAISSCALTAACTAVSGALTAKTSSAVSVKVKATSTAAEIAALPSGDYSDTVTVTIKAH